MRAAIAGGAIVLAIAAAVAAGPTVTQTADGSGSPPAASTAPARPAVGDPLRPGPDALGRSATVRVRIPSIGADSERGGRMQALGLQPDRTIEVPPRSAPLRAGWYRFAPTAGEVGTAAVLGHINGNGKPGVFEHLQALKPGATVLVDRADGLRVVFRVDEVTRFPKDRFPSDRVYGQASRPELRVISCGGALDRSARSYEDNVIVFAHAERVEQSVS